MNTILKFNDFIFEEAESQKQEIKDYVKTSVEDAKKRNFELAAKIRKNINR